MKFTVFGAGGFIGGALVKYLRAHGHDVWAPARDEALAAGTRAGHVIYAIGLTGDFRDRLSDTVDAHVTVLNRLLQSLSFDSFLYLSSTRIYGGLPGDSKAAEETPLRVTPSHDSIFDLSKLLGEALCLAHTSEKVRVARLSNVFGPGQGENTFLGSLLAQARKSENIVIREDARSAKDYVALDAVTPLLVQLALEGRERLYNVASGHSTTHEQIADAIRRHFRVSVSFADGAPLRRFPDIDVERMHREFGFVSPDVLDYICQAAAAR